MDSQNSLDIQVSGYPSIRISHPYVYFLPLQQKSTHAFAQYAFQGSFATNSVSYVESQQHHTPVPKDGS